MRHVGRLTAVARPVLLILVALGASVLPARAQQATGSIRGLVTDARTGVALARARVSLDGHPARVHTNDEGRFLLADVPAGPGVLEVSLVGYALVRRDVDVSPGASVELTIPLPEGTGTYTEEVRVTAPPFRREEPGVPAQITIGSADLQELRSLLADDPMRAVQALPGVGGADDLRSDFSVRGSDFRHVGVTLDGIPSPLLVHTVRSADDTGSVAMINTDILESVALLAGSYPQRHGNRTGAQVDFRTREGSRERTQARIAVSAIAASLVAEGPIGRARRGSWLVSARRSYLDWLVREIDPDLTGTFGFVDTQAKAVYDLTPRHVLQFTLVAGRSRYDENAESPGESSLQVGRHRSVLTSVSLRSSIGRTGVLTQRVYGIFNRYSNHNATFLPLDRGATRDASYRADLGVALPSRTSVEAGVHLQALRSSGEEYEYWQDRRHTLGSFTRTHHRQGGYLLARLRPLDALTISPGIRVDRWGITHETRMSPWTQVELALPRGLLVAAGSGLYRQAPEADQVHGTRGGDLRTERARHLDAGVGQQLGTWRWQLTLFDRGEDDVIYLRDGEPRLQDGHLAFETAAARYGNALEGTARGVELTVQRRSANGLSGWIGYAFLTARYDDPTRGESFPADAEQRHTLNVYATYRLSDRTSVSGRFRAATNTPIAGYYRELDGRYFLGAVRNTERLPAYSRLDLRGNRTFDLPRGRLTLFVEILNVYNRRNRRARESPGIDGRTGEVRHLTDRMFPIVPSAGFAIEF